MRITAVLNKSLIGLTVPVFLFGILVLLIQQDYFAQNRNIGLAITIDLIITIPLVYYLFIRKTNIPNTTVVPVVIVGLVIGANLLPNEERTYIDWFITYVLPVAELSLITYIIFKIRKAFREFKKVKNLTPDFFTALKETCYKILPPFAVMPFATEIAVFYYGFFNWRKRSYAQNEYTYHKNSGSPALYSVLIFIILVETVVFHILISRWNLTAAYVFSGLSVYTVLQVYGIARSLSKRPIILHPNSISLRYGILNEVKIPIENINEIELSNRSIDKDNLTRYFSPLGELESQNIILHLKRSSTISGLYGLKKKFHTLSLHLDEPETFKKNVDLTIEDKRNDEDKI